MTGRRVLLIGLHAAAVDFEKWPSLTPASLEAAFTKVETALRDEEFAPRRCLIEDVATAERTVGAALADFAPDVVSIGAGVRADPDHLRLFERLVNLCHEHAPQARFAFNTDPMDTLAAVRRWA